MASNFVSNYRGAKSQADAQEARKKSTSTRRGAYSITPVDAPSVPNTSAATQTNRDELDWNRVNKILDERSAYSNTENPALSLDVEIPMTSNVRKIQFGKLKLFNDVNNTGLNRDMALYIVGNTYQDNDDGTHYGMGWDGRPYSYKIDGNEVKDFTLLDANEHKKAIERLTNGKVKVDDSITNTGTLAQIYRSIKKMQDFKKGNLVPGNTNISDPDPGHGDEYGYVGLTYNKRGTGDSDVLLFNADYPEMNRSRKQYDLGRAPTGDVDHVTAHELSHAADFNRINAYDKYHKLESDLGGGEAMFEQAAKNAGFGSIKDAVATISSYALEDPYEAFAEAYVDVLYNRDNAKPFSKELVRLYNEQIDMLTRAMGPKDAATFRKEYGLNNGIMTQQQIKDAVVNYEQIKRNNNPFSR